MAEKFARNAVMAWLGVIPRLVSNWTCRRHAVPIQKSSYRDPISKKMRIVPLLAREGAHLSPKNASNDFVMTAHLEDAS